MAETCLHNWVFFWSRSQEMIILVNQRNKYVLTFSKKKNYSFSFSFVVPRRWRCWCWCWCCCCCCQWHLHDLPEAQLIQNDKRIEKFFQHNHNTFIMMMVLLNIHHIWVLKVHTFIMVVLLIKHLSFKVQTFVSSVEWFRLMWSFL